MRIDIVAVAGIVGTLVGTIVGALVTLRVQKRQLVRARGPDLTGTWTFNQEKSRLQIPAPDATVFVVDHREPALRISRTHFAGDRRDEFSLDLTTDGQEVLVDRADVRLRCRAYWEGATLVFDTRLVHAAGEATNVVRYALSSDGVILVAEERFRSESLNYDNVWMLDRVELE